MFNLIDIFLAIITGLTFSSSSNVTFVRIASDARFTGLVLDSGYMKQSRQTGNDKISCGTSCMSMTDCVSFFVDTSTSQCQFHDTILQDTTGLTVSASSLYFVVGAECQRVGWITYENSCLYFDTSTRKHYTEAKAVCEDLGSKILRVNSEEESQFIREYLIETLSPVDYGFWLGLTYDQSQTRWIWEETGLEPTYTDWAYTQPQMNSEYCAKIDNNVFQWHDVMCTAWAYPACKMSVI